MTEGRQMMKRVQKGQRLRATYLILFLLLFLVEALIALYVRDDFVRPYVGDMLVVVLVYFFVRIFIPAGWKYLPLWVFLFAAAVEGLQALHLVEALGLGGNRIARIVFGSTADWMDVVCYGAGALFLAVWELFARRLQGRKEK